MSIVAHLFETNAIQVAPEGEIFLTTSGLVTPYYVNTHFLCGGEKESLRLLDLIDSYKGNPEKIVTEVSDEILRSFSSSPVYSEVINLLCEAISASDSEVVANWVSGGERRDWFFSIPLARLLGLPHLYVFNEGLVLDDKAKEYHGSDQTYAIHAADLLTVGSSYTNKWVPYLEKSKVQISLSVNCVDRDQGGSQNLMSAGVGKVVNLCKINKLFFDEAHTAGVISQKQLQSLTSFFENQTESMKLFLLSHPEFIRKVLRSDDKSKKRMSITLNQDLYKLGTDFISQFKSELS